ncbi:hypothetical protein GCM10023170_025810 [Phytohabitans houttuyneae]|uniref:Uncharacterized protein n=1 Tax=Phytohabitans houttuyneae TaxID=1076126 RepID=A0A6V8KL03_9ACTN|nr:hypothetical protein Phou_070290 [Phytohabitans houttuyneae]
MGAAYRYAASALRGKMADMLAFAPERSASGTAGSQPDHNGPTETAATVVVAPGGATM